MKRFILLAAAAAVLAGCGKDAGKDPVDYVNPYVGNISHLLVPTYPTVQLPNSMLRVYPERSDYTSEYLNDLMGIPGDEDGGGMTSFVVFSSLGFYPVTPGKAEYAIGSPLFEKAEMRLSNGKTFTVEAPGASGDNKYIQSATLDGKPLDKPFITHEAVMNGGRLVLVMGGQPDKEWGR